ncbi:ABC transporter substrate-binding protein [Acidovorax sp. SUPP950]|uniref:ABC transporter substrate-binding protein n=1 Tax=unclassified Acidovorax TaxID=2684926 RepID=UPI00234BF471|nr:MULTISPECIES: ABC transporter substrate-binding protein [Comamonadaceae]WCM97911.1 ABC transporter substrate-binding protein [Acidovorax sp. GBBC 1281]WOI47858.1 ABC transporter substrate-binding protein [Paracidovorax avenae]GKS76394.1 ABC transporter substrate-binding protein [Acidovorax sp. SUPP950]GKS83097.1 ABC transporter substrate-binding protein [Acidovorax sp. SUPP1855]GKS89465.1 ABC transporter substrate-binding protein [Acidovorax sp. SUPP2539]
MKQQRTTFKWSALGIAVLLAAGSAHAATMRWAGANDILTVDPHAQNHQTTHAFLQQVYESLVRYDEKYQIQPALGTKWTQISPTQVRFELRKGVKFHDGAPFTADDVVFSLTRAMTPPSNMQSAVQSIKEVKKVDDFTVDLILKGPNPVLLRELTEARIMNKAWAEKNNSTKAQDYAGKEENFASRNANGTGPFIMVGWQPDVKVTLKKNPDWWDKPKGNIDEVVFTPIKSAATRSAALISGQVDFVVDPPTQDLARMKSSPDITLIEGAENRTIYLGLDQFRDELPGAGTPGKNPLKDKRVRQALYQAIDSAGIHSRTMRNLSVPAGTMVAPMVHGWSKSLDERAAKYDVEAAKKLLADAGYPQGFSLKLDCPNDRYVNDEAICQAVTAMWTRIGVKTTLQAAPMAQFVSRVMNNDVSAYLFGWGVATFDSLYSLDSLMATKAGKTAAGTYNGGRFSDAKLDEMISQIKVEMDAPKRDALIADALKLVKDEYYYLPLHHQIRPWAMRKGVETLHRADDRPMPNWTTIK